ncbi:MAG: tRNA 2-thiouridine(34) synthase MnmA [Verrucomicrobia bacterium]|nr:tRNA 2-thiouridine(34) synthase MnmA [Verrucomicrobiota bacterium]
MKRVIVGMSGGVDSSVSALLLKQQGYEVMGLFMKNWEETDPDGQCHATQDYEDVAKVCDLIGIPYYTVNFAKEYWDRVFSLFLEELKQGYTPNPDVLCNREIKFKAFFEKALGLGADFVATGHYAQTENGQLLCSADTDKDQTYFLYTVKDHILTKTLFPIGHLPKTEVRALAAQHNLATAEKKDSTGICFIGERKFSTFLNRYIAYQKGPFQTQGGRTVGEHSGVAYYTIGQRKGLAIGGPGEAWFVVAKDTERNIVFVEQGADHPALYRDFLTATEISWVQEPPTLPLTCQAKIRYRQPAQECVIEKIENGKMHVKFTQPQRAITPRQSIVFYDKNVCLGGAIIEPL